MRFLIAFFLFAIFISCSKEKVEAVEYQEHFKVPFPLHDLSIQEDKIISTGGVNFESGNLVEFDLGSEFGQIDSVQSKSIFSLNVNEDIVCTGVYTLSSNKSGTWKTVVVPELYIMRDALVRQNKIYAVGGAGLSSGVLYEYNTELEGPFVTQSSIHDLSFIREVEDKVFIGGFGMLKFDESGSMEEWKEIDEFEDHFIDLEYSEEQGIFVLGASGRVIMSKDLGLNWKEVKKPNASGISSYKDLEMKQDRLFLSGYEIIDFTSTEEFNWSRVELMELGSINQMKSSNDRLYFVTEKGIIASISN